MGFIRFISALVFRKGFSLAGDQVWEREEEAEYRRVSRAYHRVPGAEAGE